MSSRELEEHWVFLLEQRDFHRSEAMLADTTFGPRMAAAVWWARSPKQQVVEVVEN